MTEEEILKQIKKEIKKIKNAKIDDYDYQFLDSVMEPLLSSDFSTFKYILDENFKKVLELVYNDEEKIEEGMMFFITAKRCNDKIIQFTEYNYELGSILSKNLSRDIESLFNDIYNKIDILKRQIDSQKKRNRKLISNYLEIIELIENTNDVEIINFNKLENYIIDEDIKYKILIYVLKHNGKINKQISEKNINLLNDDRRRLKNILTISGYGNFELNNSQIEQLLNVKISTIELKLQLLNQMNIFIEKEEILVNILIYSKTEILENILNIIQKYNINSNFIKNNVGILFDSNDTEIVPLYNIFINNLNYLKTNGIGIHNLNNNLKILLSDFKILSSNIELLKRYGFEIKKITNFDLLINVSLFDVIDNYIEHGLYEYILENQNIIKNDYNIIIRLIINEYLGMPIFNNNKRIKTSITSGKGFEFDINDMKDIIINNVDEYISDNKKCLCNSKRNSINESILDLEIIKDIFRFQDSSITFNFDGQLISINKFLRNFSCLYEKNPDGDFEQYTFDSIIYNSVIDSLTIENIRNRLRESKQLIKK